MLQVQNCLKFKVLYLLYLLLFIYTNNSQKEQNLLYTSTLRLIKKILTPFIVFYVIFLQLSLISTLLLLISNIQKRLTRTMLLNLRYQLNKHNLYYLSNQQLCQAQQKKADDVLLKFIISDKQSFNVVESSNFVKFARSLNCKYQIPYKPSHYSTFYLKLYLFN